MVLITPLNIILWRTVLTSSLLLGRFPICRYESSSLASPWAWSCGGLRCLTTMQCGTLCPLQHADANQLMTCIWGTWVRSLTTYAAKVVIQAFILSWLDYCNSLLYSISDGSLWRLSKMLLTGTMRHEHIMPVLWQHHQRLKLKQTVVHKLSSTISGLWWSTNCCGHHLWSSICYVSFPIAPLVLAMKHLLSLAHDYGTFGGGVA